MIKIKAIIRKLQPKAKYILGIFGIAAIVSQGAFALTKLSATEPRFNFLQGDYELLRGADLTAGNNVWRDPVSGNAGDTFQGIVYYHNGIVDTTAENTTIKVSIPAKTINKTATLSASISADNAETVSDTIVDGQIVGLSGLTVNLDQDANLSLVPGSVKWYPNQFDNPNTPVSLPAGQTGDEIISANGINIGGINGCWQYAGYVVFSFKTTPNAAPNLSIVKQVRNVSENQTAFAKQTDAKKGEKVEFIIDIKNTGNTSLKAVDAEESMPSDLTYVDGTLRLDGVSSSAQEVNDLFSGDLSLGDLTTGGDKIITFQAEAPNAIVVNKTVVNNVRAVSGSLTASDTASVNLTADQYVNIILNKDAKNLTTGQVATLSGTTKNLDAKPGDTIEYTLTTKNTGNTTAQAYQIVDGVGDVLQESNLLSASDGGKVVTTGLSGNDSLQIQYPIVNIGSGQTITRTFEVKVMDPLPNNPQDGYNYDHKFYNLYGDAVLVTISIPTPPPTMPILSISKSVRDFTANEINFAKNDTATIGDTLEYKIAFSNSGNAPADQVVFSDLLPNSLTYIPGTTVISINGGDEHTLPDGIVAGGVSLDTISAGDNGYIEFKAISSQSIAGGTVLTNTANLTDNGTTISDQATTTFKVPVFIASTPLPKTGANTTEVAAILSVILTAGSAIIRRFI